MKAKHLMLAMTVLAIAGCSQNEITEKSPDANPAIGFSVYTGAQTRGTVTNTAGIYTPGFDVMAVKESAKYMESKTVTSADNGTNWTYSPAAYWPADGTALSFYSYAPHSGTGITVTSFDDDATPEIGFALQDDWNNTIDLVAAKNENVSQTGGTVNVSLKHILTKINFVAKTDDDITPSNTTVTVTGLKFLSQSGASKFYKSGTYNIKEETWSSLIPLANGTDYSIVSNGNISVNGDGSTETTLMGGNDKYLFCIPVIGGMSDGDIKLEITYKTTVNSVESVKTQTFKVPTTHFAKGTAYKYTFTISLGKITFSGTVDDTWANGSGALVPVP